MCGFATEPKLEAAAQTAITNLALESWTKIVVCSKAAVQRPGPGHLARVRWSQNFLFAPRVPTCPIWGLYVILKGWQRDLWSIDLDLATLLRLAKIMWSRDSYRMKMPGQIEDKFGTGVPILSTFCPAAGWPGKKWKKDPVLTLSSICPHRLLWTKGAKWGQKWDIFEPNDDKN